MISRLSTLSAALLAGAILAPVNSSAADDPVTIVITGFRTAQTVDDTLAPVTVISREEIERTHATDVESLLIGQAGVSLSNTGGLGKKGSLFLRGAEADHIVVLVDGIKINSATSGTAAIENLPLDQIERIEIVRGPRSSLYGADAMGGVIQIFTRQPAAGFSPTVALSLGSYNTQKLGAHLTDRLEQGWYSIGVSQLKTDGFDACRGKTNVGGCFTDEPDTDGYENQSFSLAGGVQLGARTELTLKALRADADVEFDGDFVNRTESTNTVLGAKLKVAVRDNWDATLLVGQSKDNATNYKDATFGSAFNAKRASVSLQNDLHLMPHHTLTLGVDHNRDSVSGTTDYTQSTRDNTGLFAQYQTEFGANDLIASLRNDEFSDFGAETTGNLSFGRAIGDNMRLTVAYGTAFKAPTFNELYYPEFGNPDLTAETSDSTDIGLKGTTAGGLAWALNLFRTNTDNLIAYDAAAGLPVNIGQSQTQGAELSASTTLSGWRLSASHTYLDTENQSSSYPGKALPRRAENSTRLSASHTLGAWSLGGVLRIQGASYDDLANTRKLKGFTVLDASADYAFNDAWKIGLAVNNLFDEEYETAEFYNQDGVNGMLTLRYQP